MRRVLVALSALGLASALVSVPVPVAGQTTITLSLVDASNTSTTVTAIGEDGGAQTLQVKAVASTAPQSDLSVSVSVGATGGTATRGASNDYTRNKSSVTLTIGAATFQGLSASVTITPNSDKITEQHETIRFTGTATGYTISSVDLTITDQDRVIRLTAEGDETTPKKTALTRIENHHYGEYWVYVRGDLGGVTNGVFTASTSSTYGSQLRTVVKAGDGTATVSTPDVDGVDVGSDWSFSEGLDRSFITIASNNLGAEARDELSSNEKFIRVIVNNDTRAEGNEVFYVQLKSNPAGFTHLRVPITILDDDTQVEVVVDTDSGEDGNQAVLTEGDSGSGVSVSGRFAGKWREPQVSGSVGSRRAAGSSALGSATVVTLSAAGAASPTAGQAGTGDLMYSPPTDNTVTIPREKVSSTTAGSLTGLTIEDDDVVEGAETFTVTGSSSYGEATAATVTIADDDADITLSVDETSVREGDGATTVTVTARFAGQSSVLTSATDVTVTVGAGDSNGATPGTDFMTTGTGVTNNMFTVSIPAGMLTGSKAFTLTPTADNDDEGVEKIAITGSASVGRAVTVTPANIDLDDRILVALSLHEATSDARALSAVSEGGGAQTVRVKATAGSAVSSDTTVTVTVGAAGGAAVLGASGDYTRSAATVNVTIANGDTESGTADVTITPRDDGVAEGPETIRFSGAGDGIAVTPVDLEIRETIELVLSGAAVGEGDGDAGAVTATAQFAGASSSVLTGATDVVLSFGAGANTEAADFSASAVTLSIPAGDTDSGASALSGLGITQDAIAEGAESIAVGGTVTGFAVRGAVLGITDDDLDVTLTADTDSGTNGEQKDLSEGAAAAVRVRAAFADGVTNDLTAGLVVSVTAGEGSPASAEEGEGGDFTAPGSPVTVTIPTGSGTVSSWANLTGLAVNEDTVAEGDETFLITGTVPGGTVAADTLTIGANDKGLEVSVSPGTVAEAADAHTIAVTAGFRGASGSELAAATTVDVAVASGDSNGASLATSSCPDGNMDACVDASSLPDISIPAGDTSGSVTFSLTARDDGDAESAETLTVTVTDAGDSTNTVSTTLNVVDSGIEVELLNPADDSALASLGEDSGASQVKVKVTMPGAVAAETVVGLNITEGSAAEDTNNAWTVREDYRISGLTAPSGTPDNHELGVVVAANETTGEATFTIEVQDDNADEDDEETIRVTGAAVNSLPVLGAALSITDNDDPPNVVLTLETPDGGALTDVQEDDSPNTTVQVRAAYQGTTVSDKTVSIPITVGKTADGEATAGTDYQTVGAFNVVIDSYETGGDNTFQLVIDAAEDDTDAEGPETVTVTGDATGLPVGTVGEASLTIIDDDAAITLEFLNAADETLASLAEGTVATSIKVQASYPGSNDLDDAQTIPIALEGTASASDYQTTGVPDPFQITIPANQNSATETFTLDLSGARDDNIDEADETLLVTGDLAGFIVNSGELEIVDNDGPPTGIALTANPNTAPENRGTSPLTVRLTASLVGNRSSQPTPVQVTVGARGSTATRGSDYRNQGSSSLTVTIPAEAQRATGTFRVVILSDTETESTERIIIAATSTYGPANTDFRITNVNPVGGGGGGGGGGAPPPSGGGGGGGGGGAPPPAGPPAGPVAPPPPPAEPTCQGRFCDEDGSVHQANIEQIAAWNITLGCDADDATKFCPSAQITRRQMAAFLHRAVNRISPIPPTTGIEITDVPADAWYRTFADWVVSTGAFAAPDGVFNPGGVVTRADMAVMMIASFPDINAVDEPEGLFNDVAGADPEVVRAVEGMYHTGVTRGCSTEPLRYCPDQPVTRAQMASFFVRAVNYTPPADS